MFRPGTFKLIIHLHAIKGKSNNQTGKLNNMSHSSVLDIIKHIKLHGVKNKKGPQRSCKLSHVINFSVFSGILKINHELNCSKFPVKVHELYGVPSTKWGHIS